jgi:hypothetical protein
MAGNRKHGFRRGNASGRNGAGQWYCDGCGKLHPYTRFRNGTPEGRSYCDRTDPAAHQNAQAKREEQNQ